MVSGRGKENGVRYVGWSMITESSHLRWNLALFVFVFFTTFAHAEIPQDLTAVPVGSVLSGRVSDIHPLQMEAGKRDAIEMMNRLRQEAMGTRAGPGGVRLLNPQPFEEYLRDFLISKPFPAVIMPDGLIYITDGHHRAMALGLAEESGFIRRNSAPPHLRIERNYLAEGISFEDAAADLHRQNKVYFVKAVRDRIAQGELTPGQAIQSHLPKSVEALRDNPLRSFMGKLFNELGFESDHFVNFIEFYTIDKLIERGIEFPANASEISPALRDQIKRMLLADPVMLEFLMANARRDLNRRLGPPEHLIAVTDFIRRAQTAANLRPLPSRLGACSINTLVEALR